MNASDLPQPDIEGLSTPPPRFGLNLVERAMLFSLLLVLVGMALSLGLAATIIRTQDRNRDTGLQNRAAICVSITAQIGKDNLPQLCNSSAVLRYYDPNTIPYQGVRDHALLCQFLVQVGSDDPECSDVNIGGG